jgi:hypothetical protein
MTVLPPPIWGVDCPSRLPTTDLPTLAANLLTYLCFSYLLSFPLIAHSPVHVENSASSLKSDISGHSSVVCMFNANCFHCKQFAPEFIEAAHNYDKQAFIEEGLRLKSVEEQEQTAMSTLIETGIDADEDAELTSVEAENAKSKTVAWYAMDANKHPVLPPGFVFKNYPGVFYVSAKGQISRYDGSRNSVALNKWVKDMKEQEAKSFFLEEAPAPKMDGQEQEGCPRE